MVIKKGFGSDNHAGVHPKIIEAVSKANFGHMPSYGTDEISVLAINEFKQNFGPTAEIYFVFNGTAANTLCLRALTQSYNSVICSDVSHINNDECGAPEVLAQCKLVPLPTADGKITLPQIKKSLVRLGDQHASQPKVISLTQPTELGTTYSLSELKEIIEFGHEKGLYIHLDGARLSNACVSLNCTFKELTTDIGVDILSFGGTKNSLIFGEAVVILNPKIGKDFKFIRKQFMQLPSKSRFIAAQFLAFFENQLWKENAIHACKMATLLYNEIKDISSISVTQKVESNAVFVKIPKALVKVLREKYFFYVWDEQTFECRLMTSFDTTPEEVRGFANLIRQLS